MRELIEEKMSGKTTKTKAAEPQRGAQIINLMDALKASLGQGKPPAESKPPPPANDAERAKQVYDCMNKL